MNRLLNLLKRLFGTPATPLCHSSHYRRDHFENPLDTPHETASQPGLWD
jgi:hypothetical protein